MVGIASLGVSIEANVLSGRLYGLEARHRDRLALG